MFSLVSRYCRSLTVIYINTINKREREKERERDRERQTDTETDRESEREGEIYGERLRRNVEY